MSKTILLADDSLTIQKVVELTFSDTDFEVIATSSGNELLERLPSSGADIVICDTIMPGTDGYAVCQAIKSEASSLHLPVILMTGTFEPFDRDRALAAGCSEIITKPFEAKNLVETVERLVTDQGIAAPAPEAFAGSVAPPDYGGGVIPPAPEQEASEFGTMLSPPADIPAEVTPEAPEFTLETPEVTPEVPEFAPEAPEFTPEAPEITPEIPDITLDAPGVGPEDPGEGLDFTVTGFAEMEAAAVEGKMAADAVPDFGLDFEPETPEEPAAEAFAAIADSEPEPTQPIPVAEVAKATDPFGEESAGIFAQADEPEPEPAVEEPDIFEGEPAVEEPDIFEAEPAVDEPEAFEPEPELPEAALDAQDSADVDVMPPAEFPIDTDPVVDIASEAEILPVSEDPVDAIDESPIGRLSDEDIDRIARRVAELAGDRLEKIAWEVIPDMAEIVVRERLRELEDDIENAAGIPEPN